MVIRGHYVGLPLSDLENIRTQLLNGLQALREGKTFSEVDMGGKMGKKMLLTYSEVVHDLKEVQYALKLELPDVYGKAVKRLVPNFNKALQYSQVILNGDSTETYLPEEEFIDAGARAFHPKEGSLEVSLVEPPIMTKVGTQKIFYRAFDSNNTKIEAVRYIVILPAVTIIGAEKLTGGIVKDGVYSYLDEISVKTFVRGYYAHEDTLSTLAKNKDGVWNLYGGAGASFDSMDGSYKSPISKASQSWSEIEVVL
jgi:hypothetical protein